MYNVYAISITAAAGTNLTGTFLTIASGIILLGKTVLQITVFTDAVSLVHTCVH